MNPPVQISTTDVSDKGYLWSKLVPAEYTMRIINKIDSTHKDISLNITGNETGYGNGYLDH